MGLKTACNGGATSVPAPKVAPFFMFSGRAEEAMRYYVSIFDGEILSISRYGPSEPGPEGSVQQATFALHGQTFMCIDSYVKHDFTFTPAISLHMTCDSAAEVDRVFGALAQGGTVLMPLGEYPFSPKFGWVQDQFGVSWQLDLRTGKAT